MLDAEEIKWIKSTANELNNLLHEIAGYASRTETVTQTQPDAQQYVGFIVNAVERATRVTHSLLSHVQECEASAENPPPASLSGKLFNYPRPPAPPEPPPKPESKPVEGVGGIEIANPEGEKELIMLVDDETHVLLLSKTMLADEGYRIIAVQDGFKALETYKALGDAIDLVVLDYHMPILDGSEVFDELQALNPRIAVVLSSGFAEQAKLGRMLAKGLRGFIPKPYTRQKLLLQIRSVLDAAKGRAA